jgi:hypothetical protein
MALAKAFSGTYEKWQKEVTEKYGKNVEICKNDSRHFAVSENTEVASWSQRLNGGWILAN